LTEKELTPVTWIDVPMPVSYASKKLVEQLRVLEPFGKGNENQYLPSAGISPPPSDVRQIL